MFPTALSQNQMSMAMSMLSKGIDAVVPNSDISELEQRLFDENGNFRLLPSSELLAFGFDKLRLLGHEYGIYQFPTLELIEILTGIIGDKKCIEIGSGRGDIGRLLNIKTTDSHQQSKPQFRQLYESMNQPIIKYPKDVERLGYKDAIKKYRPDSVLGCWVTHRYEPKLHHLGGNIEGIDGDFIVRRAKKFIFVGNTNTHKGWRFNELGKCQIYESDGIISRAASGKNFVAVFNR